MNGVKAENKAANIKNIIFLQLTVIVYTLSGIFGKMATDGNEFLSPMFFLFLILDIGVLGVYALLWQQNLKKFDLHVAYANRSLAIFWSLIWSVLIFKDKITIYNIIGTAVIIAGIVLVTSDAEQQ